MQGSALLVLVARTTPMSRSAEDLAAVRGYVVEITRNDGGPGLAIATIMKLANLLVSLPLLVACTEQADPPTRTTDAYFIAVFAPHTSPEDCLANSSEPRGCRFAITLCADGRAARRIADIVEIGTYQMADLVAVVDLTGGRTFEFDVLARRTPDDSSNTSWILDVNGLHTTLPFDTIDCGD